MFIGCPSTAVALVARSSHRRGLESRSSSSSTSTNPGSCFLRILSISTCSPLADPSFVHTRIYPEHAASNTTLGHAMSLLPAAFLQRAWGRAAGLPRQDLSLSSNEGTISERKSSIHKLDRISTTLSCSRVQYIAHIPDLLAVCL